MAASNAENKHAFKKGPRRASSARPTTRDRGPESGTSHHAEDNGSVRWGSVKANDIAYLVDEQRITRHLECLATVRLQAERCPHSADRGVEKASFPQPSSGSTSASRRLASCATSARSRQQPDRR